MLIGTAAVLVLVVIVLVVADGDHGAGTPVAVSSTSPIATPAPSESTTPSDLSSSEDASIRKSLLHLALGDSLPLKTGDAGADTYEVVLGKVLGRSAQEGDSDTTVGFSVTIRDVAGSPVFDASYMGLRRAAESSGSGFDEDGVFAAVNRAACGGLQMINGALTKAGATDDTGTLTLADGQPSVTGCVAINAAISERPTSVVFADSSAYEGTATVLGAWEGIRVPGKVTRVRNPPPPRVTYKVTGSGSTSLVTYTTSSGAIEQNTSASLPYTKKVDTGGSFYQLSAQDSDGAGSITCQIIDENGSVLDKHTSKGPYAIASCMSSA